MLPNLINLTKISRNINVDDPEKNVAVVKRLCPVLSVIIASTMKNTCEYSDEECKIGIYKDAVIDFETSLNIIGFGRYQIYLIVACGISLFSVNTTTYCIGYVLPAAECDMNLNTTDKGLLTAIGFIGIISSIYAWGALADTRGRKNVLMISLIGTVVTSIAAVFTMSFWLFTFFLFLNGVFISGSSSTIYAYLGEFICNSKRSKVIAWCTLFMNFALAMLAVLAWMTLSQTFSINLFGYSYLPWRLFILICNLPCLIAAAMLTVLPESPKYLILRGKISEAVEILQKIYTINSGKTADTFSIRPLSLKKSDSDESQVSVLGVLQNVWRQTTPLFHKEHLKNISVSCTLQFGAFAISSGLLLWYPDILSTFSESYKKYPNSSFTICKAMTVKTAQESYNCQDTEIDHTVYLQNLIIGLVYCMEIPIIAFLFNILGKRLLLVIHFSVSAICCIVITFITSKIVIDILFIIVLVPPGVCVTILNTAVVDIFPTQFKAMAISLSLLMGRLGSVVASSSIGYLMEMSCNGTFYIYAGITFACMALALLIPNSSSH